MTVDQFYSDPFEPLSIVDTTNYVAVTVPGTFGFCHPLATINCVGD
jgi:hypothetical protein